MSSQSKLCVPTSEPRCRNLKDYRATDIYCLALDRKWLAHPHTAALGGLEGSLGYFLWLPVLSPIPNAWMTPNVPNEGRACKLLGDYFSELFLDSSGEYSHIGHLLRVCLLG